MTCKDFGRGPLSDETILKAAKEFVTVCIYNNATGNDGEVLKSFEEPAWNNPVVRFLDSDGKDIIPRKDGVYTTAALLERMKDAQSKFKTSRPEQPKAKSK